MYATCHYVLHQLHNFYGFTEARFGVHKVQHRLTQVIFQDSLQPAACHGLPKCKGDGISGMLASPLPTGNKQLGASLPDLGSFSRHQKKQLSWAAVKPSSYGCCLVSIPLRWRSQELDMSKKVKQSAPVYSTCWMSNNFMPLILSPQHGTPSHE